MDGVKNNRKISISELEKHLNDYKRGRAQNSKEVGEKLPSTAINSSLELSSINPGFGLNYSLYRSTMSYSSNARFIKNIDDALPHISTILRQTA